MNKIFTVVGARPQFIKAAPVCRTLREQDGVEEILVHTGQHHDTGMSDIFFEEMGIPIPDHHLGVRGGGHGAMTGAMLQRLEPLMQAAGPDWVLVYGDTNSTLAGALTAAKLHLPVAHVEAGLRSFNRRMPEEHNRVLTDHLADLLFTPTPVATSNLQHEGIPNERIAEVGDVMYDAVLYYAEQARARSRVLNYLGLKSQAYVLATVHRAENTDNPLRLHAIFAALERLARTLPVVLPLHPRTRGALRKEGITPNHVTIIDPVGYLDMTALTANAAVVATDSGGLQKEAYFNGVPCVTLRDETEWLELVEMGWNRLAPPVDEDEILKAIEFAWDTSGKEENLYGNGTTAQQISERLLD